MIAQAANGFIVRLPEGEYLQGPMPIYRDNDLDLRTCLADPKWIYKMAKVITAAKNGDPLPEEAEAVANPSPLMGNDEPDAQPENNYVHIFSTWTEASQFMQDFFKQ